jgi:catechol 2,3-dioxygenase-like lactoylglutathione lyase family enzyme
LIENRPGEDRDSEQAPDQGQAPAAIEAALTRSPNLFGPVCSTRRVAGEFARLGFAALPTELPSENEEDSNLRPATFQVITEPTPARNTTQSTSNVSSVPADFQLVTLAGGLSADHWEAARHRRSTIGLMGIELVAILVDEYDPAIAFFVEALGFELVEDSPSLTNDGRPKRWVVVRPPGETTGLLLARADGDTQSAAVGNQIAGRVGFFLRVDDFNAAYQRINDHGVEFVTAPRHEPYGSVAVFRDIAGNRWDLLGPAG